MPKLLFTQHNHGHSWSNDHHYYECTQEEYDEMLEKYKDYQNYTDVFDETSKIKYRYPKSTQVTVGRIYATPCTMVYDGFCERGGREFDAYGITIRSGIGAFQTDYSTYNHYIKPGSISKNKEVKHEGWWAS